MDFYQFWHILNEWDPNEPDEGPEDHIYPDRASEDKEFRAGLRFKNGVFYDVEKNRMFPVLPPMVLQDVVGEENDTYTLDARVIVSGEYLGGYDAGGGDVRDDELHGEPVVETDGVYITNDRTGVEITIPDNYSREIIGKDQKSIYRVDFYFYNGKFDISIT